MSATDEENITSAWFRFRENCEMFTRVFLP